MPKKPQLIPNAKKHSQAHKKIFMGTKIKIHLHFFLHAMSFFWADGTFFSGGGALFFHGGATFVSRGWSAFVGGPIGFANRWAPSGHHDLGSACDQALGQLHFTTKWRKTGRAEVGAGSGGPGLWRGAPQHPLHTTVGPGGDAFFVFFPARSAAGFAGGKGKSLATGAHRRLAPFSAIFRHFL